MAITLTCGKKKIAENANLFLEVTGTDKNSIEYSIHSDDSNTVTLTFDVKEYEQPVTGYKLEKVLQIQIVTMDELNSLAILRQMYPISEGYHIEVVETFPTGLFTSDLIANVLRNQSIKKDLGTKKKSSK